MKITRFSYKFVRCKRCFLIPACIFVLLVACRTSETQQKNLPAFELTSASFSGEAIPPKYSCDGEDSSPELSWQSSPVHTQSFTLMVIDIDAPLGSFVHWLVYDIPADKHELPEGLPKQGQLADGSRQGQNDFQKIGYGGPCPPGKSPHRYVFSLYALDTKLNLPAGVTEREIRKAMSGHILAKGELIGRFHH